MDIVWPCNSLCSRDRKIEKNRTRSRLHYSWFSVYQSKIMWSKLCLSSPTTLRCVWFSCPKSWADCKLERRFCLTEAWLYSFVIYLHTAKNYLCSCSVQRPDIVNADASDECWWNMDCTLTSRIPWCSDANNSDITQSESERCDSSSSY